MNRAMVVPRSRSVLLRQAMSSTSAPACLKKLQVCPEAKRMGHRWSTQAARDVTNILEYDEFNSLVAKLRVPMSADERDELFDFFDRDQTGDVKYDDVMSSLHGSIPDFTKTSLHFL
ncbi:hypothetical protein DIPPA_02052 [Diplonema papillatum]|nr:hypothetical protein DIPPA_02052 [Diplonema papillatum]